MNKPTWTILGLGHFVFDLLEAIHVRGEQAVEVVLNQEVDQVLVDRLSPGIQITSLKNFTPHSDQYIFGFVEPRKDLFLSALAEFQLPFGNLIHPFSSVASSVEMGMGNFVGAGVVLGPNVRLGNFNYVNRCASVGHDTQIKNQNHIGPGVVIPGRCVIGNKNFFGANSTLLDGLTITDQVTLAAGAVATKNISQSGTFVGIPAKLVEREGTVNQVCS